MPNYRDAHVTLIIEPADGEPFAWFGGDASVYASSGEFDAKVVWLGQQEHVALSPAQLSSVRAALAAAPAETDDAHTETIEEYRIRGWRRDGTFLELYRSERHGEEGEAEILQEFRNDFAGLDVRIEYGTTTSRRESEWKATDQ